MDFVTVYVASGTQSDVYFIKSFLEEAGIPSEIFDENISRTAPHYSLAVGGPRVVVQEKDAALAKEIIQEYLEHHSSPHQNINEEGVDAQQDLCPKCQSQNISISKKSFVLPSFLVSLICALPIPLKRNFYQCSSCGHRWSAKKSNSI